MKDAPWLEPRSYGHWTVGNAVVACHPDVELVLGYGFTRTAWGFRTEPAPLDNDTTIGIGEAYGSGKFGQLALRGGFHFNSRERGPHRRLVVADGMRASEVVQGLRGFLGPGGGEATPVDLSVLVREMLPLVRRELEDNRVKVDLDLAEALPPVEGARVRLGQVVVNLVVNACEALSRQDGARRIAIATGQGDGRVELSVRDNGPGLDTTVAERIFEPFVTTKPDGLGVGLAISRSIAERHGGHLRATSPPEGGLVMTLSLPAAPARGERGP